MDQTEAELRSKELEILKKLQNLQDQVDWGRHVSTFLIHTSSVVKTVLREAWRSAAKDIKMRNQIRQQTKDNRKLLQNLKIIKENQENTSFKLRVMMDAIVLLPQKREKRLRELERIEKAAKELEEEIRSAVALKKPIPYEGPLRFSKKLIM